MPGVIYSSEFLKDNNLIINFKKNSNFALLINNIYIFLKNFPFIYSAANLIFSLNAIAIKRTISPLFGAGNILHDLKTSSEENIIDAIVENIIKSQLCTSIQNNCGIKVSTIEHLMSALNGLGIDNALIAIDSDEVPILDGSSKIFVDLIVSNFILDLAFASIIFFSLNSISNS